MAEADPTALSLIAKGLERVEGKLDALLQGLNLKADRSELQALELEHEKLAGRVGSLEEDKRIRQAKAEVHSERDQRAFYRRIGFWKVLGSVLTVSAGLAVAVAAVVQAHLF